MKYLTTKELNGNAFYLPLLELKMLFDNAKTILELEPFNKLSTAQQWMFKLIEESPQINIDLQKQQSEFDVIYDIALNYLTASGVISPEVNVANDFIKTKYTPYESLLLKKGSGGGFSLYFALVSKLQFSFESASISLNYKTKYGKEVKGYSNLMGTYLSNEKYEGCLLDTQEGGMLVFMQGKKGPLKVNSYEEFLAQTHEIIYENDYEYGQGIPLFYPELALQLSPPTEMVVGLEAHSRKLNQLSEFRQFNMLSKIKLDKYGIVVETGATMEVFSRGISRQRFVVEDNVFIYVLTREGEIVNSIYLDKEVYQF